MTRRHCACAGLLIAFASFAVPVEVRGAAAPDVRALVKDLTNDTDPAAQAKARDALVAGTMAGNQPAQPMAMLTYAQTINNEMLTAMKGKLSLRAKINVAIVVARIAERADNGATEKILIRLIQDPDEAVVLWGLRGAQYVVKHSIKANAGKSPLAMAIFPAVQQHPSGLVFEEAYSALGSVEDQTTCDELNKLWDIRLQQYKTAAPDDPVAEAKPVFVFASAAIWKTIVSTPVKQTELMQRISDQLMLAAQWADGIPSGDKHDQLLKLLQQCGSACQAIGMHQNQPGLVRDAADVARINPVVLPAGTKVTPRAKVLSDTIRQAWSQVKPAPEIAPPK